MSTAESGSSRDEMMILDDPAVADLMAAGFAPVKFQRGLIAIETRGPGAWAVTEHGECLNRDGEFEWEPQPSSRDREFLSRCRFSLSEALAAVLRLETRRN